MDLDLWNSFNRKSKTRSTAKLHRTDLVICTHSREGKTQSYSRINTVSVSVFRICKIIVVLIFLDL